MMKLSTAALSALIADIAASVKAGDSFEGNLSYSCMEDHLQPGEWEVWGGYRIGNTEGQGGFRLLRRSDEETT